MKKPLPRKYKNPFGESPAKIKTSNYDVLTIGAATRDVFVQSSRFKNIKDPAAPDGLDACFPLGAKIDLNNVVFETGGGATNAAVTFARFGLKTACIARVGKDAGGKEIKEKLTKEGIDTSYIQTDDKQHTGYSFILVSETGQRAILVYRGAAAKIDAKQINWKRIKPEWVYLTSLAGDEALLKKVFLEAKKIGSRIVWNPGNAELSLGFKKLTPYLLQCDILLLNREEAAALANMPPRHLDAITHALGTLPRQAIVITDGANGAYMHSRGSMWYAPVLPGKRINTTGAGDAFGSAFAAGAIKTGNLEKAFCAGMLNAFGVITHMGAKAGILKRFPSSAEMRRVKIRKL